MLTSLHLHKKSREVCINARSPPASLPFKGQATEMTTVKWPIGSLRRKPLNLVYYISAGQTSLLQVQWEITLEGVFYM